jgi:hypothetical protein
MLTPRTLQHLAHHTCPRCGQPLGRFHVYLLTDPVEVLRQTTEHGPMHRDCAHEQAEAAHRAQIAADPAFPRTLCYALYVVKATPSSPSARIIRLHPEDPASKCLLLFSPEKITFYLQTLDGPQAITREADYDEITAVMEPAAEQAGEGASAEEQEEIVRQVHRLHKFLPKRPKTTANDSKQ